MTVHATHLMDEMPIMFYPSLAVMIGTSQALVFQRLHWLLNAAKEDDREYNYVDGRWWVYNTYPKWKAKYFTWLSEKTIKNTFLDLEKRGFVLSMQSVKEALDREKWYSIDYEAWETYRLSNGQKLPHASGKNGTLNGQKLPDDLYSKTTTKDSSSPKRTPPYWQPWWDAIATICFGAKSRASINQKTEIIPILQGSKARKIPGLIAFEEERQGLPRRELNYTQLALDTAVFWEWVKGKFDDLKDASKWGNRWSEWRELDVVAEQGGDHCLEW